MPTVSMDHHDHVRLISSGIAAGSGGVWADLGAGTGAFTLALRDVTGPDVEIIAIDRNRHALQTLRAQFDRRFPGTRLQIQQADFTEPLALPPLDGIISANAIHYTRNPTKLLQRWRGYVKPGGCLIVVEYDTDAGNQWVPYPLSFPTFGSVARAAGFAEPALLGTVPSRFLGRMYAAGATPI
jgi:ubiquinone/menaquinone biosynthesis C-methylase UbiE